MKGGMRVRKFGLLRTRISYFGHANIIKYCHRPFLSNEDQKVLDDLGGKWHNGEWKSEDRPEHKLSRESVQIMDAHLIDQINKVVKDNDVLYHLGDFHFAYKDQVVLKAQSYLDRIHCRNIHIVWGNHDCPGERHPYSKWRRIDDLFASATHLNEINVQGQRIVLCHYAMNVWNKSHRGSWHLYGHSHSEAEAKLDSVFPGRRSMDVGVDNAKKLLGEYRPFSFDEIRAILKDRPGSFIDHHVDPNTPEEGGL